MQGEPDGLDDGLLSYVYFGNQRMLVVGYTPGGAPYGPVETLGPGPPGEADDAVPEPF